MCVYVYTSVVFFFNLSRNICYLMFWSMTFNVHFAYMCTDVRTICIRHTYIKVFLFCLFFLFFFFLTKIHIEIERRNIAGVTNHLRLNDTLWNIVSAVLCNLQCTGYCVSATWDMFPFLAFIKMKNFSPPTFFFTKLFYANFFWQFSFVTKFFYCRKKFPELED